MIFTWGYNGLFSSRHIGPWGVYRVQSFRSAGWLWGCRLHFKTSLDRCQPALCYQHLSDTHSQDMSDPLVRREEQTGSADENCIHLRGKWHWIFFFLLFIAVILLNGHEASHFAGEDDFDNKISHKSHQGKHGSCKQLLFASLCNSRKYTLPWEMMPFSVWSYVRSCIIDFFLFLAVQTRRPDSWKVHQKSKWRHFPTFFHILKYKSDCVQCSENWLRWPWQAHWCAEFFTFSLYILHMTCDVRCQDRRIEWLPEAF